MAEVPLVDLLRDSRPAADREQGRSDRLLYHASEAVDEFHRLDTAATQRAATDSTPKYVRTRPTRWIANSRGVACRCPRDRFSSGRRLIASPPVRSPPNPWAKKHASQLPPRGGR